MRMANSDNENNRDGVNTEVNHTKRCSCSPPGISHVTPESYCFLCQRDFRGWPGKDFHGLLHGSWEKLTLVARKSPHVFPRKEIRSRQGILAKSTLSAHTRQRPVYERHSSLRACRVLATFGCGEKWPPTLDANDTMFCWSPSCPRRDTDRPAHIAHHNCWAAARKVYGSLHFLLLLARTTRRLFPLDYYSRLEIPGTIPDIRYGDTPLGKLLRRAADRLPCELKRSIMNYIREVDGLDELYYVDEDDLKVTWLTRAVSTPLACPRAKSASALPVWERVACQGDQDRLTIETTRILGLEYIVKVSLGGPATSNSVQLQAREVRGVRFALDSFGLCAVRVLYEDSSMSPWLGNAESVWFGEVSGCDLSQLWILGDVSLIRLYLQLSFP